MSASVDFGLGGDVTTLGDPLNAAVSATLARVPEAFEYVLTTPVAVS
jgi:hypothetical protein